MIVLVTYDITDPKRLRKLHAFLKEFGLNTQKSVFECDIDKTALKGIRRYCKENLDLSRDSVRIYKICSGCIKNVIISGLGLKITQLDYMVV
ncbi:MAG: CRISPR-associated endonuclease Cas2 [Deltaproteobacteria bacterium]|jgi:CRISPR-associated protein Cas2|nr:CRISPR-associated endonuclease Cas2 [Deltaproteobacteria bacterium]